jgi:hypothetical protein
MLRLTVWGVPMGSTLEDGLRALEEATELAKNIRIDLTDEYLQLIAAVEALPQNQSGADKSGRWLGSRAYWSWMADARLVKRYP